MVLEGDVVRCSRGLCTRKQLACPWRGWVELSTPTDRIPLADFGYAASHLSQLGSFYPNPFA